MLIKAFTLNNKKYELWKARKAIYSKNPETVYNLFMNMRGRNALDGLIQFKSLKRANEYIGKLITKK